MVGSALAKCRAIFVLLRFTIRNFYFSVQLDNQKYTKKSPTMVQPSAAQNHPETFSKFEGSLCLPFPISVITNSIIFQRFSQATNYLPTLCTTWVVSLDRPNAYIFCPFHLKLKIPKFTDVEIGDWIFILNSIFIF